MKWLYKLERRFGRYAIPNLMMYITLSMGMVFLLQYFTGYGLSGLLALDRGAILQGQLWRLITFLFVPGSTGGILGTLLYLYLNYMLGLALEEYWGSFKFNLYYLCGILSAYATMALLGFGTNYYLNLTLFLAYAYLNPNREFLLFFVLPVKVKYLALVDWLLMLVLFIQGPWAARLGIALALLNFFIFFGGDFLRQLRNQIGWWKTRRNFRRGNSGNIRYH